MFAALFSPDVASAPALVACAQAFSPRVETQLDGRLVLIDVAGLGRIVGDAHEIAAELRSRVGPGVTIALAPARVAAWLFAVAGSDAVVRPGETAAAVGALGLSVFHTLASLGTRTKPRSGTSLKGCCALCSLAGARRFCGLPGGACTELITLGRWGLSRLGELAALPSADLAARLGQMGVVLQRLARGLDMQPLVPIVEEARFEASLDLEWPIEDLQPLSFVLARLLEPLGAALERADRGAAAIVTELTLVRFIGPDTTPVHVRRLELPAPMRDPRVLRTLILLDLESHPPPAGIDRVSIRIEPTQGRIVQFSLLERAGPQPETITTLVSRLTALMGEGRVGSPVLLDSHAPDAFALDAFRAPRESQSTEPSGGTTWRNHPAEPSGGTCLRRFRLPVPARVVVAGNRLVRVTTDRVGIKGGEVQQCAGPWRSSGHWWSAAWDRDEYDVALADGAAYRVYRDRHEDTWFVEGILD